MQRKRNACGQSGFQTGSESVSWSNQDLDPYQDQRTLFGISADFLMSASKIRNFV